MLDSVMALSGAVAFMIGVYAEDTHLMLGGIGIICIAIWLNQQETR